MDPAALAPSIGGFRSDVRIRKGCLGNYLPRYGCINIQYKAVGSMKTAREGGWIRRASGAAADPRRPSGKPAAVSLLVPQHTRLPVAAAD